MNKLRTKGEAESYLSQQNVQDLLTQALNLAVRERASNAALVMGEFLIRAGREKENIDRMRDIFDSVDSKGTGLIGREALEGLMQKMGEPLQAADLSDVYASMGGTESTQVGFDAFSKWYISARSRDGTIAKRGDAYTMRARRASRMSRISNETIDSDTGAKVSEVESTFDIKACHTSAFDSNNRTG